jgi:CRISPR-associated endonuclease Csn1
MPELRNPTVQRALNELRKVTNNLLRLYGRPDVIRIELTRELKKSKQARSERLSRNEERKSERRRAIADLEAHGIANPSRDDIEKWLLWKESNERCPYTGDHIGFDALFREGKYQVEHIWPRSRSLDNTFANKTLCRTDINILKGKRTPYEVWGHDPHAWHALKQRLADCRLPEHKVRRFIKDMIVEAGTEEFADRQLADTGWAARAARDFLKRLWPDDGTLAPVETVNGRITAQLRHQWGLDSVLNPNGEGKTRADHRHHAIDALTAALTTRAFVKRLSDWYQVREIGVRPPKFERPWLSLLDDAKSKVEQIVVSHKTRRKASGPLHDEKVMGDTRMEEKSRGVVYRFFVKRKSLKDDLSQSEIKDIRDRAVREIVREHIAERGGDPKKAFPPYPRLPNARGDHGPEIRRVRIYVKKQPELMEPVGTGFAFAAANHHMAIYRMPDDTIDGRVVSLYEAARRLSRRQQIVQRERGDGARFVMSLCPGDTLEFPHESGSSRYRIVQSIWSNGQVVLIDHTDAAGESKNQPGIASIIRAGARKVSVDPIGRVRPARD